LREEARRVESSVGPVLEQCDVYAREVRKRRDTLVRWQDDLEQAVKDETNQEPERQDYLTLLQRARAQREEAEFDEAIKTYEEILNRHGDRPDVRKLLNDLVEAWKLKGEGHAAARTFAYGAWGRVKTVDDVRNSLPRAREALDTCKRLGDRLTALKLFLASTASVEVIVKATDELEKGDSDVDRLNLQQVKKVNDDLQEYVKDVSAFARSDDKKP
jgi:hypothetical protein